VGLSRRHHGLGRLAGALLRTQPDERLVAMVRDGAQAPFDELVRRHRASLIAFAGTLAPPSRAEDVVQESLLKAYSALQDGAKPELLRAWLFRIVRNTAIDEQRGVRHHEELDENYDGVEQPPQALDRREQVAVLVAAIGDLPAAQREAIVKRELEGRGHEEIGRALELSPGAVRQLIYRARHTLREAAGTVIPVVIVRAASMPGADEAVGGIGMAGALKFGVAAIVATGTIVAGSSIQEHHGGDGTAEAEQLATPHHGGTAGASQGLAGEDRASRERHAGDDGRDDRSGRDGPGDRGPSGDGGGSSGPSGASDDGMSQSSGPGSDGSGSGSSGSDDGGISGGGTSGDGRSGSGTGDGISGDGFSGSGSSGSGSSGSGSSGSGSEDGGTLLGTSSTSHDGRD
jgi:RNA polymerase sigma factor (sigma-70 family)